MKVLIGSTGFVGGTLADQIAFDAAVHRPNLETVRGVAADLVVCAGMPAAKWRINQDPAGDRETMVRLMDVLGSMTAERFLLVSTIDVYAQPTGVDESVPADLDHPQAYGRHRAVFEAFVREQFPDGADPAPAGTVRPTPAQEPDLRPPPGAQRPVHEGQSGQHVPVLRRRTHLAGRADRLRRRAAIGQRRNRTGHGPIRGPDLFGVHLPADGAAVAYDMHTRLAQDDWDMGSGPYLFSRDEQLAGIAELKDAWTGPVQ